MQVVCTPSGQHAPYEFVPEHHAPLRVSWHTAVLHRAAVGNVVLHAAFHRQSDALHHKQQHSVQLLFSCPTR